jgi:hypothetical protein
MKWRSLLGVAGVLALAAPALAQGTFQNLNLEAARLVFVGFTQQIATTNALPGWTAYSGGSELSIVTYNTFAAVPKVGLYGSNSYALAGDFGVALSTGGSITQTGVIPADAKSLFFKERIVSGVAVPVVVLGGQTLTYTAIQTTTNYTLFGADISRFAGQTTLLSCSVQGHSQFVIDDFEFSPVVIPEPGVSGLIGFGASCFAARWVHRRSKRGG